MLLDAPMHRTAIGKKVRFGRANVSRPPSNEQHEANLTTNDLRIEWRVDAAAQKNDTDTAFFCFANTHTNVRAQQESERTHEIRTATRNTKRKKSSLRLRDFDRHARRRDLREAFYLMSIN